jgi:hypothetical protein
VARGARRSAGYVGVGDLLDVWQFIPQLRRRVPLAHRRTRRSLQQGMAPGRDLLASGVRLVLETRPIIRVITIPKKITTPEYKKAWLLGFLMFEYLPGVMPKASIAEKRKVADEVLLVCVGKRSRMTPELLAELIAVHSSCVHDQEALR